RRGIVRLLLIATVAFTLCGCGSDVAPENDDDSDTRAALANAEEAASLVANLEGAGTWQVEAIVEKNGDVTVDLSWDGMAICFVGRKAVFTRECISYGTDGQTVIETLGEYPVDYVNGHIIYIGGEKFDISRQNDGSLTLKSEKTIIIISH
ncbi:MAG: hypothetical protein ACI3YT_08645, partial [Prevotella sp.]